MNVWVLFEDVVAGRSYVQGIFDSLGKAQDHIKELEARETRASSYQPEYRIEEYKVQ